ncbi:MAG: Flp pilus assembly protein CpaB [Gammaproteobacteria bacterium]|nr:Flp pilus assembly protein CpaB [Gammaproteobacteria bacterium]NNM21494.1 Flp pilus assembly protein CpaB [Gammaproteobacteria bacterium]
MATRRGIILLVLSLMMGVGAAWVANNWVTMRLLPKAEANTGADQVVVAAMEIPYGTKVEDRHLRYISMPPDSAPDGSSGDLNAFAGKVSTRTTLRGEILLQDRFAEHLSGSTLSAIVSPNMRAVTIRVDDVVGVAGFLLPGNRVDIVASRKIKQRAVADIILSDLKVLAVDQTTSTDKNEPIIVRAVTLEMTPEQAVELVKARQEGKIQLTLRNPLDDSIHLVQSGPPPQPAAQPVRVASTRRPPVQKVTVIRGTAVSTVKQTQ